MSETVAVDRMAEVIELVRKVAEKADFKLTTHPNGNMLMVRFNMGNGRAQTVYIRYSGRTFNGQDCVTFLSPCRVVKNGKFFSGGLSKEEATDLLRRNAKLHFGSFVLETFEGQNDVLMVASSQIAATMDPEELNTHVAFVALAADEYERERGTDTF